MTRMLFVGLLAAGFVFATAPAHSAMVTVTVNGNSYDVSTVTGKYESFTATLESQIWWEDFDLAKLFAEAVGDDLGLPNVSGAWGPIFAHSKSLTGANFTFSGVNYAASGLIFGQGPVAQDGLTFATATLVGPATVPEPSTLALLALGLAGAGLSRLRESKAV